MDEIIKGLKKFFKDNLLGERGRKIAFMCENGNLCMNRRKEVFTFTLKAPEAKEVVLVGDFNGWDVNNGVRMKKSDDGIWTAGVELTSGRYEYKFIVDGEWKLDPENNQTVANVFGSLNSVKQLTV